ncbi:MAG TPA: helical backbone metal receptor [Flavisolibacter sp.]|jgi:ABC-type Fe3+-hydroxamate transport system substrate-binding protein|nr:helical backbone metal receptor [Flavisolibacter sp.]
MLFTDQLGRTINLPFIPQRIISVVPSQTELLSDLGLDQEVLGITKFCVHPDHWFRRKQRVGGTKQLNLELIRKLQPDLIIANKEENSKDQIETLSQEFPVYISDVNTIADALNMIMTIGTITGKAAEAIKLSKEISECYEKIIPVPKAGTKVCYLIWKDPYMTVGGDTFIHEQLKQAGLQNVFGARERYPEICLEELKQMDCSLLLLSSEPFPFSQKHKEEIRHRYPHLNVILVDGEIFSWYGSRLLKAPAYLSQLAREINALSVF